MSRSFEPIQRVVAACPVKKKPDEETEVQNDDKDVTPEENPTTADDDKQSRDVMTSSDPERGDGGADNRQETGASPSANETAQTATADNGQTDVQSAPAVDTSSSDGTASPTTDRKENSDKPETEAASSGTVSSYRNCPLLKKATRNRKLFIY